MCPILPESSSPPPEVERKPLWRREYKRYALGLVLLIHLALLASVVLVRSRQGPPKPLPEPPPAAPKAARPTLDQAASGR